MNKGEQSTPLLDETQLDEIASVAPFQKEQLKGQRFARGNMLGGAVPIQEASRKAPWEVQE